MEMQSSFDKLISKVLEEQMHDIEIPAMDDSWNNIQKHMAAKNKKRNMNKKIVGVAAAILVFISLGIGINNEGYASYFRTLRILSKSSSNNVTQIKMDNKTPGESKEENILEDEQGQESTITEHNFTSPFAAKDIADFLIKEPAYLPEGYVLEGVILTQLGKKTLNVEIEYSNDDKTIRFSQEPIRGQYAMAMNINEKYGKMSEKLVNGTMYYIIQYKNGSIEIFWDANEVKYTLEGKLSEEELFKMIHSIPR